MGGSHLFSGLSRSVSRILEVSDSVPGSYTGKLLRIFYLSLANFLQFSSTNLPTKLSFNSLKSTRLGAGVPLDDNYGVACLLAR